MIKPLKLGNLSFPTNLVQGPLAGISCAPFRRLIWKYSQPAFTYTEMISCQTIIHPTPSLQRYIIKDPQEGPVCFQLAGNDPVLLGEATRRVTDYGADLIDLNCGCPVNKIRSRGAGSRLLASPEKLYALIQAMKLNTHVPVSIKIRVDGHSQDNFNPNLIPVLHDAGLDFITIHGRHWSESYQTPCHYDQIQFFVDNLSIPIIGNGDITDTYSLQSMLNTGCHGAMICRAGVGQPWLIQQLTAENQATPFSPPSPPIIGQILLEHVKCLANLLHSEKKAIFQARTFAKYYARSLQNRDSFARAINDCHDLFVLEKLVNDFFF